ncbi:MAG: glycolate oxidase subunit GlcE [Burkholderiaceae bacterium]
MTAESPALLDIREAIGQANSRQEPLCIRGGGTKDFYGQAPSGNILSTRELTGIVSYEPTELVITARAGTPLNELNAALSDQGQFLPFEPPVFGSGGTVGGMVAAGLSGPRRAAAGAVRDYMLGACLIDSRGQWLAFGGQVMKNVAGYDISRLLSGSLGILGVIAEVSLKVLPLPTLERSVVLSIQEADAIRLLNELSGQPLPISASSWQAGELNIRFSGAASAVTRAVEVFDQQHGATELEDPEQYWQSLRDQQAPFFDNAADQTPLWRLSVPSSAARINLPGQQLIEWGGALRWWRTDAPAQTVRSAARSLGGTASLFRGGDKSAGVFEPLAAPLEKIHRKLKAEYDPLSLFNPGRMYPGL